MGAFWWSPYPRRGLWSLTSKDQAAAQWLMPSKMPIYLAAEHCSGEPMSLGILLHELFKSERELDDVFLLLLPLRHFPLTLPFSYPLISSISYSFLPFPSCFHHAMSPIPLLPIPFSHFRFLAFWRNSTISPRISDLCGASSSWNTEISSYRWEREWEWEWEHEWWVRDLRYPSIKSHESWILITVFCCTYTESVPNLISLNILGEYKAI